MSYMPYIAAIVLSIMEIIGHKDIRERLEKDHPEVSNRAYIPSDIFMYILIIAEIFFLVTSIVKGASGE